MNVALSLVDSFFCCSDVLQKCSHTAKRSDNTNFNLFVAAISRRKSNQFEFVRLVAATKFCCSDNDFDLNSPVHTKRFVAATCCSDMSPRVYRPLLSPNSCWKTKCVRRMNHDLVPRISLLPVLKGV